MKYKYSKQAGALQDGFQQEQLTPPPASRSRMSSVVGTQRMLPAHEDVLDLPTQSITQAGGFHGAELQQMVQASAPKPTSSIDTTRPTSGQYNMFFYTVEDGQRVLVINNEGHMEVVEGPKRIWRWRRTIKQMVHHVAHPGDFLIVRHRDGTQHHHVAPAHLWFDPRVHMSVDKEEALPIAAKEAVVVYHSDDDEDTISRRIVHGPASFVPIPGEWLHSFSWHGSAPSGDGGYHKVPNGLVFEKLWLMPDQMYHDVRDVRTADDALLTIRLMLFFELRDIEKMLATTHDPIGDFINAAASDIIEFVSRHDFEAFKQNTEKLNDIKTYKQLASRAEQCGYHIDKVVYRGYGAPANLQKMHDEAIESRTRLQLERTTEQQAQDLEDAKLERTLQREVRQHEGEAKSIVHELSVKSERQAAWIKQESEKQAFLRQQRQAESSQQLQLDQQLKGMEREHLTELAALGVNLTELLTQGRADQVIELRNDSDSSPHIHMTRHPPKT